MDPALHLIAGLLIPPVQTECFPTLQAAPALSLPGSSTWALSDGLLPTGQGCSRSTPAAGLCSVCHCAVLLACKGGQARPCNGSGLSSLTEAQGHSGQQLLNLQDSHLLRLIPRPPHSAAAGNQQVSCQDAQAEGPAGHRPHLALLWLHGYCYLPCLLGLSLPGQHQRWGERSGSSHPT